jgi:hypothetical protein
MCLGWQGGKEVCHVRLETKLRKRCQRALHKAKQQAALSTTKTSNLAGIPCMCHQSQPAWSECCSTHPRSKITLLGTLNSNRIARCALAAINTTQPGLLT